jgi:chaperonin GroEL (HSP60 family)
VLEVKARITGQLSRDLLEPHRRFVLELAVQAVGHKKADRVLFLFNDLLLVTKPKKKSTSCEFVSDYFLNKLTVMDLPDAAGTEGRYARSQFRPLTVVTSPQKKPTRYR